MSDPEGRGDASAIYPALQYVTSSGEPVVAGHGHHVVAAHHHSAASGAGGGGGPSAADATHVIYHHQSPAPTSNQHSALHLQYTITKSLNVQTPRTVGRAANGDSNSSLFTICSVNRSVSGVFPSLRLSCTLETRFRSDTIMHSGTLFTPVLSHYHLTCPFRGT